LAALCWTLCQNEQPPRVLVHLTRGLASNAQKAATVRVIRIAAEGSKWLTGGAFGVDASLVALAICGTVGVLMLMKAVRLGHIVPPPWKRKG